MIMTQLILFEGPDRLGKSTQAKMFVDNLNKMGHKALYLKSPFNDGFSYRLIYWMLKTGWARKLPNLFQIIHFINKLFTQWIVLPFLSRGKNYPEFVVMDRWDVSMWAYGISDGASVMLTEALLTLIRKPDFTFLFKGQPHITGNGDSYEADDAYQQRVRQMYDRYFRENKMKKRGGLTFCSATIRANQPVQDVQRDILDVFYWL